MIGKFLESFDNTSNIFSHPQDFFLLYTAHLYKLYKTKSDNYMIIKRYHPINTFIINLN